MKQKFSPRKFFGYLFCSILTFLAPIALSCVFTGISVFANGTNFNEEFRIRIFDQIIHSVLCLLILVLIPYLFFGAKTHANLSEGWDRLLGSAAITGLIIMLVLCAISCLHAANLFVSYFLAYYKIVGIVELLGAVAGIIIQCMTHREAFMVA